MEEENDAATEEIQADAQNDAEQGQMARKVATTLPRKPRTVILLLEM